MNKDTVVQFWKTQNEQLRNENNKLLLKIECKDESNRTLLAELDDKKSTISLQQSNLDKLRLQLSEDMLSGERGLLLKYRSLGTIEQLERRSEGLLAVTDALARTGCTDEKED